MLIFFALVPHDSELSLRRDKPVGGDANARLTPYTRILSERDSREAL